MGMHSADCRSQPPHRPRSGPDSPQAADPQAEDAPGARTALTSGASPCTCPDQGLILPKLQILPEMQILEPRGRLGHAGRPAGP